MNRLRFLTSGSKLSSKCQYSSLSIKSVETSNVENSQPINLENQFEHLSAAVTPLAGLDYAQQLGFKRKYAHSVIGRMYRRTNVPNFKTKILKVIPSPITEHYRNKDEFSVNTGIDGDPKTVGFYLGTPTSGQVICVPPRGLINMKEKHVEIAEAYQEYIRVSPLRACLVLHDGGFWRNLIVRSNRRGETMALVIIHPKGASDEVISSEMHELSDYFSRKDIISLYYQACPHTRCSNSIAPYKLLFGKRYLYEEIGPYKFQVSPDSFFQINTAAAEVLYEVALGLAGGSQKSTLLDLCCGTGTFSILGSSYFRGCIGIESLEEAVKDATNNAQLNNVTNCQFIAGSVEKKLTKALRDLDFSPDIVGILNPGRSGVLKSTIKTLRNCSTLRTLVYISCKADNNNTMNNFVDLVNPSFDATSPFVLSKVQPIDMFPHTKHCELIMVFKR